MKLHFLTNFNLQSYRDHFQVVRDGFFQSPVFLHYRNTKVCFCIIECFEKYLQYRKCFSYLGNFNGKNFNYKDVKMVNNYQNK